MILEVFLQKIKIYELEELLGYKVNFIQENLVSSKRNVLRGLHFQKEPYSQSKLITVLKGEIFDVVIDLKKSKTYLKYFSINLSEECNMSLFIPKGFAHGYLTVSEYALVSYKVDNVYSPEKRWN